MKVCYNKKKKEGELMEKFYTLPEISDILRCSIPAIRRRIKEGKLKAVKNGRAYIISQSALDSYLQTYETASHTQATESRPHWSGISGKHMQEDSGGIPLPESWISKKGK